MVRVAIESLGDNPADYAAAVNSLTAKGVVVSFSDYTNSIAVEENKDALEKIKASGRTTIHELTPAQRKAWFEKMKPIYGEAQEKIGKEIVTDLLNAAGLKV